MNVVGTRTRRHTIGLIPTSQTLTCRIASASAASSEGFASGTRGFGRRFIRPDYRLSARPSPDTPGILMLSFMAFDLVRFGHRAQRVALMPGLPAALLA